MSSREFDTGDPVNFTTQLGRAEGLDGSPGVLCEHNQVPALQFLQFSDNTLHEGLSIVNLRLM